MGNTCVKNFEFVSVALEMLFKLKGYSILALVALLFKRAEREHYEEL